MNKILDTIYAYKFPILAIILLIVVVIYKSKKNKDARQLDENGNPVVDENGNPLDKGGSYTVRECIDWGTRKKYTDDELHKKCRHHLWSMWPSNYSVCTTKYAKETVPYCNQYNHE